MADFEDATLVFTKIRNVSGAIYAASNAALMYIQLGDDARGIKELEKVARRAPGSIDMRAALAAVHWARGEEDVAEQYWSWACTQINSGQVEPNGSVLCAPAHPFPRDVQPWVCGELAIRCIAWCLVLSATGCWCTVGWVCAVTGAPVIVISSGSPPSGAGLR